MTNMLGYEVW